MAWGTKAISLEAVLVNTQQFQDDSSIKIQFLKDHLQVSSPTNHLLSHDPVNRVHVPAVATSWPKAAGSPASLTQALFFHERAALSVPKKPRTVFGQTQVGEKGQEGTHALALNAEPRCSDLTLTEPAWEEPCVSPGRRSLVLGRLEGRKQGGISISRMSCPRPFSSGPSLTALSGHPQRSQRGGVPPNFGQLPRKRAHCLSSKLTAPSEESPRWGGGGAPLKTRTTGVT